MIEQVEKVRSEAQMQMLSFPNLEYFLQGQVHILLRGPTMQLRGLFPLIVTSLFPPVESGPNGSDVYAPGFPQLLSRPAAI